jgi:transposase
MNSVGCDLHKKSITMHVKDQDRKTLGSRRFECDDAQGITRWLRGFEPFRLVVEATGTYEWFAQLVEPLAERVVLAHPAKLRVIAESTRKSDRLDAKVLADFLALDMIPQAYRPTPRQREHRRWVRHRHYLRRRITSVRNRMRYLLSSYNADRLDLFTRRGRQAVGRLNLQAADRFAFDQMWREYDLYFEQLNEVDKALRTFAETAPTTEAQAREVLRTIPGVGPVTTEVFLSEVADVRRFGSQKKVVAYAGLAPGQRESAGKRRDLNITHCGSGMLRWALNQASWQLVRRDLKWRRIFENLTRRRGKKRAITAISRRLLCVMASMVMNGQRYRAAV